MERGGLKSFPLSRLKALGVWWSSEWQVCGRGVETEKGLGEGKLSSFHHCLCVDSLCPHHRVFSPLHIYQLSIRHWFASIMATHNAGCNLSIAHRDR